MLPGPQTLPKEPETQTSSSERNTQDQHGLPENQDALPPLHHRGAEEGAGPSALGSTDSGKERAPGDQGGQQRRQEDATAAIIIGGGAVGATSQESSDSPPTTPPKRAKTQKLTTTPIDGVANEVMMHIFSHLDPQMLGTASLVCRRFHSLLTSPHAWRSAFSNYFPQHVGYAAGSSYPAGARYFTALSAGSSYRSEYMLRTQLLRALKRGRPNAAETSPSLSPKRSRHQGNRPGTNANLSVVTYNPQIQKSTVTHLDADFGQGSVIAGSQYTGLYSHSNPRTGYVTIDQKRHYAYTALSGLLSVSAAGIGAMDVSAGYGCIIGDASTTPGNFHVERMPPFPTQHIIDMNRSHGPNSCITAVWIAKRQAILDTSREEVSPNKFVSSVCSASGSSKGVVQFQGSPRRWDVSYNVCPGIPILEIRVDDGYTEARMAQGKIWCVILNAIGEIWYLKGVLPQYNSEKKFSTTIPEYPIGINQDLAVKWHCIPSTRKKGKKESPVGPSIEETSVSLDKMSTEEIEEWAEQLKKESDAVAADFAGHWGLDYFLEVDFAEQNIITGRKGFETVPGHPDVLPELTKLSPPEADTSSSASGSSSTNDPENWKATTYKIPGLKKATPPIITTIAMDNSHNALVSSTETSGGDDKSTFPGFASLSRLFAIGTSLGNVFIYNCRQPASSLPFGPLRIIQTDSPAISSLAMSSLYLVHGGADGLVQAWDPLSSVLEPVRTLHSRFSQRARRRLAQVAASNMAVGENQFAAGALFLDPDPTELRGVVALGSHLRSWSFANSSEQVVNTGKRRKRGGGGNDATGSPSESGKLAPRGSRFALLADIEDATSDIHQKKKQKEKREKRFLNRFGVGGPEQMTDEEMMAYARMLSEESFEQEQHPVAGGSSPTTAEEKDQSWFSEDSEGSLAAGNGGEMTYDEDPELARAIRESLMDAGDNGGSGGGSGSVLDRVVIKEGKGAAKKGKSRTWDEPDFDKDLELAIRLSLAEQEEKDQEEELYEKP